MNKKKKKQKKGMGCIHYCIKCAGICGVCEKVGLVSSPYNVYGQTKKKTHPVNYTHAITGAQRSQ
jgi:hypothetical protein